MKRLSENGIKLAADFSQAAGILKNDFTDQNLYKYGVARDALVDYICNLEEIIERFVELSNDIRGNEFSNKKLSETKEFEKLRVLTSEARIATKKLDNHGITY